jgi:hypothetical protein
MNTAIQQEILLVTNSTLSKRQLCEKNIPDKINPLSQANQLEEACWNGLLEDLFPGMINKTPSGKVLPLWKISQGTSFLEIELSEYPHSLKKQYSIDPYCIFEATNWN